MIVQVRKAGGALGGGQQKEVVGGVPCLTSDVTEVRWPSCGWSFHTCSFLDQSCQNRKQNMYVFVCVYIYVHTHT